MRLLTNKVVIPLSIILVILISGYFLGLTKSTPQETAVAYLELLKNKDYQHSFELTVPNHKEKTLSLEYFTNWQAYLSKNREMLNYYNVKTSWNGFLKPVSVGKKTVVYYNAKYRIKNETKTTRQQLILMQVGGYLGLFPKWQIVLPSQDLAITCQTSGASIFLDEKKLAFKTSHTPVVLKVFAGSHHIQVSTPDTEPRSLDTAHKTVEIPYLTPKPATLEVINQFETAWQQAHISHDPTLLTQFFAPDSSKLNSFMDDLKKHTAKHTGWRYRYSQDWQENNYQISDALLLSPEEIRVSVEETWWVTNAYSDGTKSSPTPQGYTWEATLKKSGNTWLIN